MDETLSQLLMGTTMTPLNHPKGVDAVVDDETIPIREDFMARMLTL